jgi:hypothetical protein
MTKQVIPGILKLAPNDGCHLLSANTAAAATAACSTDIYYRSSLNKRDSKYG